MCVCAHGVCLCVYACMCVRVCVPVCVCVCVCACPPGGASPPFPPNVPTSCAPRGMPTLPRCASFMPTPPAAPNTPHTPHAPAPLKNIVHALTTLLDCSSGKGGKHCPALIVSLCVYDMQTVPAISRPHPLWQVGSLDCRLISPAPPLPAHQTTECQPTLPGALPLWPPWQVHLLWVLSTCASQQLWTMQGLWFTTALCSLCIP